LGSRADSSISIAEVAKAAGVSTATVSRVLNDFPGVRSETVHQVHMAVEALNYRPQRMRRNNKAGHAPATRQAPRTGHIAAITLGQTRDWLQLPVMGAVVAGIQRAAGEFGLRLLLDDIPDPSKPSSLVQGRHIDGAIVFLTGSMPVTSYDPVLAALRQRVPIVWAMGMEVTAGGVDHITPDNIRIGGIAHNYLVGEGCKHLAFLTTDPSWAFIRLRGQSFLNSAVDADTPATAYLVGNNQLVAQAYGQRVVLAPTLDEVVAQMAASNPRPTGIFVACDRTTAQLYPVLARHGLQVGRDVTLVSCDNEQIRLSALHPRPASIDIGAEEIGFRSVVRLLARLRRPQEGPVVIQVSPRLAFSELPPQSASDLIHESNRQPTAAI
jgi:LacI family transcriptional regulator